MSDARTDGRFLQLSGMRIVVDLQQNEGSRILSAISSGHSETPVQDGKEYTIAMTSFIADGFDGYTFLKDEPTLLGVEGAMTDTALVLRVFRAAEDDDEGIDETDEGIERARREVVVGMENGLPLVFPKEMGRISFK